MQNRSFFHLLVLCLCWGAASCTTEDVDPAVSIKLDSLRNGRISEKGGVSYIRATLNGTSKKEAILRLSLAGTAVVNEDYSLSATEIRIAPGDTVGSVTLTAIDNSNEGGDKSIIISILSTENIAAFDQSSQTILISDDDLDSDQDSLVDALDDCPADSGSVANHGCPPGFGLIVNEVLYDPATDATGDANADGVSDKFQDGFVELFNNTNSEQDLSGFVIADLDIATNTATDRFTFPANTKLPAKKALVVFGGGTPTGSFGGATVLVVGTQFGLSMQNSGEKILIRNTAGNTILTFDSDALSNNPDESYTRNPDVTGAFVQHGSVITGKLFSPGTKIDGSSF